MIKVMFILLLSIAFLKATDCSYHEIGLAKIGKGQTMKQLKLNLNEPQNFTKDIILKLVFFTHKRPYVGGPTKATATVSIKQDGVMMGRMNLSVRGVEGTPEYEYDSFEWNGYHFELKEFNYDESIEISVNEVNE